jgi:hypothetical protein
LIQAGSSPDLVGAAGEGSLSGQTSLIRAN